MLGYTRNPCSLCVNRRKLPETGERGARRSPNSPGGRGWKKKRQGRFCGPAGREKKERAAEAARSFQLV